MSDQTQSGQKDHWLDNPEMPKRLWTILIAVCVVLVISEFFVTHSHDGWMFTTGFHAVFGFVVGGVSIVLSKGWKKILKRKDTYYDE